MPATYRSLSGKWLAVFAVTLGFGAIAIVAGSSEAERRAKSPEASRAEAKSAPAAGAQAVSKPESGFRPTVRPALRHDTSRPLREMKPLPPQPSEPREIPLRILPKALKSVNAPQVQDPVVQTAPGAGTMPAPLLSFEGGSDDENETVNGFRVAPPDTNGDVGPNHYVQYINLIVNFYDKAGTRILGPVPGNFFWTGFGGVCETHNDGDPIVLYDQLADRWLASQFALFAPDGHHQCIAVSTGPDPTGSYNRYDFLWPNNLLNDYPKFGIWPDAYYMTANEFIPGFEGFGAAAFDRTAMLAGGAATMIYFHLDPPFGGALPSDMDGLAPPAAGAPNIFMEVDDESVFGDFDRLSLWEFHVDWVTPANSTFGIGGQPNVILPTAPFVWGLCNFSRSCIPQPGTTTRLDAISDRLMYRLAYRNFGTYEAIVTNHTVDAGSGRAGVRWYELRNTGSGWAIYQQGTFAPTKGLHRWMGSAAMDSFGNIAVGYSVSSGSVRPSIRYAGRLVGDPLGELTQGEAEMHIGTGSQTCRPTPFGCFPVNRWGDYSMMTVDPVDECTFWYTQEYYQTSGPFDFNTRIGSFTFAPACSSDAGTLAGMVTDSVSGLPIAGAQVQAGAFGAFTDASGFYSRPLAPGTYDVTASAFGHFPQTVPGVVITTDTTTTQDFALDPAPTATVSGTVTDGSGHGWPLYVRIDVGGAPIGPVFTNPVTGFYSVSLPEGGSFTLNVNAISAGYNPESRAIIVAVGGQTENFALTVAPATCTAPGYGLVGGISESFESGIPPNWTVITNGEADVMWTTTDSCSQGNRTGGSGGFAIVDSDCFGQPFPGEIEDTELRTPSLDFSAQGTVLLRFDTDFFWYEGSLDEKGDVDVSTDGGSTWANVLRYQGASRRGPRHESIDISALAGNQADVRVRFHYYDADWEWWWEVDNVRVGACLPVSGGLLVGNVFHASTGAGLNGVTVTSDNAPTDTTATFATPDDPAVDDGFYFLFSSLTGAQPFTASKSGFESDTQTPTVIADAVVQQNFNLPVIPTLTVSLMGTGSGTVTSDLPGIDCGADCTEDYPAGTVVTLSAAAAAGPPFNTFAGWGGDCSGVAPCVVTMDAPRNVSANFIAATSDNSFFKVKVLEAGTGIRLAGATVGAYQGGVLMFTTTTNANGNSRIAVTAGTWDLTASAPGHTSVTKVGKTIGVNQTKPARRWMKFRLPVAP